MMDRKDFSHLGEDIKDIVSKAVSSMDFDKLNQDIKKTAIDALDQAKAGLAAGQERMQPGSVFGKRENTGSRKEQEFVVQEDTAEKSEEREKDRWKHTSGQNTKGKYQAPDYRYEKKSSSVQNQKSYPAKHLVGSVSGMVIMVCGILLCGGFGITAVVMLCLMMASGFSKVFPILFEIFFLLACVFGIMAYQGNQKSLRVKRFYQYIRILGERSFCELDELASQIGRDRRFVIRDVRKMIAEGMFLHGYLDDQETCLMVTEESYQQYRMAQDGYKRREEKEKKAVDAVAREAEYQKKQKEENKKQENKKQEKNSIYDNEEIDRELLNAYTEGRKYLDEISKVNRDISKEEISAKISHMEVVIRRIFKQVQSHPEQLEEIRRFMEYYLPTTLKLVTAYSEFEAQPIQGETITKAKHEIEETLDTINDAFEKLLDSLFEATALDISTDISVMNTMLAQEGLKKDMFEA